LSINALGIAPPFNVDVQAGVAAIPITAGTHAVEGDAFNDTNITATLASVPINSINASALNSTNITTTRPNIAITDFNAVVVGTPNDSIPLDITAGADALPISKANATVAAQFVGLATIPDLTVAPGATRNLGQYIYDEYSRVTNSQVLGLNPAIATYSHATKLLTDVSVGTMTGLQLEVTF